MQVNRRLGHWVSTQRHHAKAMKQGKRCRGARLTSERVKALESIGFAWEAPKGSELKIASETIRDDSKDEGIVRREDIAAKPSASPPASAQEQRQADGIAVSASNQLNRSQTEISRAALMSPASGHLTLGNPFIYPSTLADVSSTFGLPLTCGANASYHNRVFLDAAQPSIAAARDMLRANALHQDLVTLAGLSGGASSAYPRSLLFPDIDNARLAFIRECRLLQATESLLSLDRNIYTPR